MTLRNIGLTLALMAGLSVSACGGVAPTYEFKSRDVSTTKDLTQEQVTAAILKAGGVQNWQMIVVRPGLIEAKREWGGGKHNIVVDVVYNSKTYEINYKSSRNLKFSGGAVHRAYNRQTIRLYDEIHAQTSRL